MNDKTMMELKLSAQFVGQTQQNISPSFQFIQNLIEISSNPSLESLTAEVEALEANNKQLEELSPVIDIATDFAQADPKVGDPKFDKDKKFVGSLDALSQRIQHLYVSLEDTRERIRSAGERDSRFVSLNTRLVKVEANLKRLFDKVQTLTFLITCHDSAVDEPIKTTSNPVLAQFL
ncbi:hypothetical protein [Turicimonas muris]|uniref:hypothetical protein n=2 Tax=Turicimonas muris TaxID=1796652 RepID=UPI0023F4F893|nr:hypothetical protein [Turicimonas muris]MBS4769011.1 hypothetical protein [Burkholderiales bacterium]